MKKKKAAAPKKVAKKRPVDRAPEPIVIVKAPVPKRFVIAAVRNGVAKGAGYFVADGKWGTRKDAKILSPGPDLESAVLSARKALPEGTTGLSIFHTS